LAITRNDIYERAERGPEWLESFFRSFAENQNEEIVNIIKNAPDVASIVKSYRDMVCLDAALSEDETVKTAGVKGRQLSKRAEEKSTVDVLKADENLLKQVESLLHNSGGHKKTVTIIRFLRDELGKESASFSDEELKDFIEHLREKHQPHTPDCECDAGKVGLNKEDFAGDGKAEYAIK
jgi:hypothetical protein